MEPEPHLQTVLFSKVVLALMLGRMPPATSMRSGPLTSGVCGSSLRSSGPAPLVDALLADYGLFHLEADLRWIELTSARLTAWPKSVSRRMKQLGETQ